MTLVYDPPEPFTEAPQTAPSIPHSREAEEAVLGSVLINPNCLFDLLPFLKSSHFFIHRHRWIWDAFVDMDARRTPIDSVTLAEELDRMGKLAEVGGPAFLTALVSALPSSANAVAYGRTVEGHALRREMIAAANEIAALAYNEKIPVRDALGKSKAAVEAVESSEDGGNFMQLGQLFGKVYQDVEIRSKDPKAVWGFATGLPTLDEKTGGLQQGELWYLAGAPGVGKTWLDLTISMELGKHGPGAIISLEMKRGSIGRRLLSGITGISTRAMKSGFVKPADFKPMAAAVEQYTDFPVWVDDGSYDTNRLRSALMWAQRSFGLRWFVLDYALLLMDRGADETEQSKLISANLKRIVHDLNIAGLILHSVTKGGMGEKSEPTQADQRGSGQAIHDCDLQIFLTPLYEKDPAVADLPKADKSRMATLWGTKGRELEESKFKIHLVRRGASPFWGEWNGPKRPEPPDPWAGRKDLE